jgi:hypothetical protein
MSGDDLRVTTAHLCHLAVEQGRAASEIRSATVVAEGVDATMRGTHGTIASATARTLETVLAARRTAGQRMAAVSDDLCDKLTEAAKRYDEIDNAMSGAVNAQMQTG